MAEFNGDVLPVPTADSLRQALARRRRDQEVVVVLHPEVVLDERLFELSNPGVTVRRSGLVQAPNQVFAFDLHELLGSGMATVTDSGLQLHRLPGPVE